MDRDLKSELVDGRRFPSYEHAERETLHWIGFYNEERLHEELGRLPPVEYEELNIKTDTTEPWLPEKRASTKPRALIVQLALYDRLNASRQLFVREAEGHERCQSGGRV